MSSAHQQFMQRALALAERGLYTTQPNPRVGCVIVQNNKIIAEGWHQVAGLAHAEIHALQQAGELARGATCYVTLEPCSHYGKTGPCCEALIKAGIVRVVAAMQDPNPQVAGQGFARLQAAGIVCEVGICEAEAKALNPGFIKRMETGMPYVRAKLAMSLDGRMALANGQSQWLTSEAARQDGHIFRARSSAIVTGINTVLIDNPQLTARLEQQTYYPLRVIIDTQLRMPVTAACLSLPGKTLIATCNVDLAKHQALLQAGAEILVLPSVNNKVNLTILLKELANRQCNEVHIEAGAILTGAMVQEKLIDELVCYIAPKLLGDKAQAALQLPKFVDLAEVTQLKIISTEKIGEDIKLVLK